MTVKALTGNDDLSQGYYSENEMLHSVSKETVFFKVTTFFCVHVQGK